MLWPPGGALSTAACSVAALGNGGYDGDMAGGEELSDPTGTGVRGRKRVRGEGETTEELTAGAAMASASSGALWSLRIRRRCSAVDAVLVSMERF